MGIVVSTNQSTNIRIWSSNSSRSVKNPVAQLLDTGNLVFRDENEKQNFGWQSFDHPADTFLPGMKFGYDLVTGIDRYFLPWITDDDPAPGNYIQRVDKNGYPQLFLWRDSVPLSRNGPWIGSRFSGIPVLKPNGIFTSRFVMTETEVYYVFDLVNASESTRYTWDREKNEWSQFFTNLQVTDCDRYGICGTNGVCNVNASPRCECMEGFDLKDWAAAEWTNGCSRKVQLECVIGDGFMKHSGLKLPDTRWSWYNMSMNLVECEEKCLKDCNYTITANQTISDGQTIVSARGEFEMGFFSPKGNPKNRYFGIWYKKISNGTVVWVANRETPIANTSGIIRVSSSMGIVVSTNQSTTIRIWWSNSSRSVKNPVAQLLDTGNLVFRDENEKQNYVWQSFDHPGDTILPGMKFGYDLVTAIDRYLVPWKSDDDPAPGNYTCRLDKNGFPQGILWKDSVPLVRARPWVGSRFSSPSLQYPNGIYRESFVITETEAYYVFNILITESPIAKLTLTPRGVVTRYTWNREKHDWTLYITLQEDDCDSYGICGTNGVCNVNKSPRCECMKGFDPKSPEDWAQADWTNGCWRKVQLECGNGDGFMKFTGVKLPDTRWSWYNMSMNHVECEEKCLKDCNCTAYSNTDIRNGGSGCLLWFGGLNDMRGYSEDGQDLHVRMPASELKGNRHSGQKTRVWIVIIPVFAVLTAILCLFLLYRIREKRIDRAGKEKTLARQDLDLPLFSFMQIAKATDNFSNNRQLGKGGFGTVYKGILEEGLEIAVKRLSKDSRQGVHEFMNEVSCIAKLQHRNLVMLLGCCIEEGERLLIYEYLPNKSLDYYIFDKSMSQSLNWPMRYNIIVGIARGLLYLHQDSRLKIIHRDLKASNILLDHEMNPKISDFGLARTFGEGETPASTTRVVGTHGYMSPEYAFDGLFSVKSDVYSFGVSLLEVIAGKRNRGFVNPDHNLNLIGHVWKRYTECNLLEVVDSMILESSNQHEVFRAIQIGLLCVQEYPEDRPNMSSIIMMLTRDDTLSIPKQPGFFLERRSRPETGSSPKASTMNTISVSSFAPR